MTKKEQAHSNIASNRIESECSSIDFQRDAARLGCDRGTSANMSLFGNQPTMAKTLGAGRVEGRVTGRRQNRPGGQKAHCLS